MHGLISRDDPRSIAERPYNAATLIPASAICTIESILTFLIIKPAIAYARKTSISPFGKKFDCQAPVDENQ
jgi:hypothetical protein